MEETALCVIPIVLLVAIFGTIVAVRWFKHREILAMVEKGLLPAQCAQYMEASRGRGNRGLLGWGIALTALGVALMIGLWPLGFIIEEPYPFHFGPWMLTGLIPLFIGLALLITYFLTRSDEKTLEPGVASVEEGEISSD